MNDLDTPKDAMSVTPENALREMLHKIETGEVSPSQLLIVFAVPVEDGLQHGYMAAGLSSSQHIALVEIHKVQLMSAVLLPGRPL